MSETINLITSIGTVAAAGAAVWSALGAKDAAKGARDAAGIAERDLQGGLIDRLLSEYGGAEMLAALALLRKIKECTADGGGATVIESAAEHIARNSAYKRQDVDDARRRLHWYVKRAYELNRLGILADDSFRRAVVETNGFGLWRDIALPLARHKVATSPELSVAWADDLLKKYASKP